MKKINQSKLLEVLNDSGFSENEIEEFIKIYKSGGLKEQCECLQKKRKKLLDKIHKNEKNISCIDYLDYILRGESNNE